MQRRRPRICVRLSAALLSIWTGGAGAGYAETAGAVEGFRMLDLRPIVNMGWRDDVAADGKGGWTDQGDNDLRGMTPGRREFLGIPFDVIDATGNGGKAVLTMKSRKFPNGVATASVRVSAKARSIYFLHASAWTSGRVATYAIAFTDGTPIEIPINAKAEISDWWGAQNYEKCRVAFLIPNRQNDSQGLVVFGWDNAQPDKEIRSIEFRSENGDSIPIIAAVTLSDKPVTLPDPKDIPTPDHLKSDADLLDKTQWFPVLSERDPFQATPVDQSSTLDAPAGTHGFMKNVNGRFVFDDGTPCKLVATLQSPFVPKDRDEARYIARWLAKWGFNLVRFHALAGHTDGPIIDWTRDDTQHLNAANLDKMDMLIDELARAGIYTRFSMLYYKHVKRGDGIDMFDQALKYKRGSKPDDKSDLVSTTALTFFDPKVMEANIEVERAIMTHRNPYRENRMYGEDPAICQIEVCNEDSMFFYTADHIPPHYKHALDRQWNAWLLKKYGSQDALAKAWGPDALFELEQLDMGTVKRLAIWEFNQDLPASKVGRASDQLRFYAELNSIYFTKTKDALRAAGVKQPICGSGWLGPNLAFWADLYSNVPNMDYIDRHHYWGGGPGGWQILPGLTFNDTTPLTQPEIMLKLSAERVMNLPFGLSEWANTLPNQWRVSDPALMAFYGQGLNGWDVPIHFAHDMRPGAGQDGFVKFLKWMWPVTSPETLCQYPTLSKVIRRGDVTEGAPAFVRNLSEDEVFGAKPLKDVAVKFQTSGIYEVGQDVNLNARSLAALYAAAVGKTGLTFSKEDAPDLSIDLNQYIDMARREIRSATGELYWNYGVGYVTANTPRIQSATGFITDIPIRLSDCEIRSSNRIVTIHVCSWDGEPLKTSKHILITALGRTRNTDMAYTRGGQRLLSLGKEPILLEGVKGTVSLRREGKATVTALSPLGYKVADVVAEYKDGAIVIPLDGRNQAAYYDVVFGAMP